MDVSKHRTDQIMIYVSRGGQVPGINDLHGLQTMLPGESRMI